MTEVRRAGRCGIIIAGLVAITAGCCGPEVSSGGDQVVLVHGLGRTDRSMLRLQYHLEQRGYRVTRIRYLSREERIETLVREELADKLRECCSDPAIRVHFVTHSMGGILVRYYLANQEMENLGRVVMLSPPNRGSELADWVGRSPILRELLGPSARQLGTDSASVPLKLGGVDYELGIITGDRSLNPFFSDIIPGEDDGKVSVEGAKVAGMTDFIVVPYSHSYIMMRKEVIDQVIQFLERGMFDHRAEDRS